MRSIPEGRVTTYGLLAHYLGSRAVRAVATAVGKNPDAPRVPCHRVVRADGSIGRYSGEGGVQTKQRLLESEGVVIENGKIDNFDRILFDFSECTD